MLVRSTAESTANVNPHYLSRLPSERGLKRDVPTHARIYFRVPLVRRLRPATDAFWWPKRPLEISRSSVVSFFRLCASFIEKNLGVFWGVFVAGVDEKLVEYCVVKLFSSFFFLLVVESRIVNYLRISLEKTVRINIASFTRIGDDLGILIRGFNFYINVAKFDILSGWEKLWFDISWVYETHRSMDSCLGILRNKFKGWKRNFIAEGSWRLRLSKISNNS